LLVQIYKSGHLQLIQCHCSLGESYINSKCYSSALVHLKEALSILTKVTKGSVEQHVELKMQIHDLLGKTCL